MKTQLIMITLTTKFAINNFGMESSYADSILKLFHADSKPKSLETTPSNYGVESLVEYSKPKLFRANFRLEFIFESKFPTKQLERCHSMECQLFNWSLPKSNGP